MLMRKLGLIISSEVFVALIAITKVMLMPLFMDCSIMEPLQCSWL